MHSVASVTGHTMPKNKITETQIRENKLDVQEATVADLECIHQMVHALAKHHGDVATPSKRELEEILFPQNPWLITLVAKINSETVGYAVLCPLIRLQLGSRGLDIHHLFVVPDMRGKGIGTALIKSSIDVAQKTGCSYVTVGTRPDNISAQKTYEAFGFERKKSGPRFNKKIDGL